LHAELAHHDPAAAARLAPHDAQRIQRALEVWRLTGRPLSAWQGTRPAATPLALISLEPRERSWLHARIAARADDMLARGFVDEVRRLRARADLHAGLPALRAVGYRQIWQALDTATPEAPAALRERVVAATRQLAKRQLTWLRSMPARTVVEADAPDAIERTVAAALDLAERP
ncbi:MAG TPA: tRNA dimethylallyltransferase, partial [Burkholderiaceae bacterium]